MLFLEYRRRKSREVEEEEDILHPSKICRTREQ
jgi:hypothetical protein